MAKHFKPFESEMRKPGINVQTQESRRTVAGRWGTGYIADALRTREEQNCIAEDGSEQQARWSNKLAEDGSEHKQDGRDRERKRATLLTHSELEKNKTASVNNNTSKWGLCTVKIPTAHRQKTGYMCP
jgi:hypothetical protein